MIYKILKAELEFDKDNKLTRIISTIEASKNDVRKIAARGSNLFWMPQFPEWEQTFQKILQRVSAHGSEID